MKKEKMIQFLVLLVINLIICVGINYLFLKWFANDANTTVSSVIGKSIIMAILLTVVFTGFKKKKTVDNDY